MYFKFDYSDLKFGVREVLMSFLESIAFPKENILLQRGDIELNTEGTVLRVITNIVYHSGPEHFLSGGVESRAELLYGDTVIVASGTRPFSGRYCDFNTDEVIRLTDAKIESEEATVVSTPGVR